MSVVKIENHKLDAKLQALLFGAYQILGNIVESKRAKDRFIKISHSVTNEWTEALITLIFSVINKDFAQLESIRNNLEKLTPTSIFHHNLMDEYAYYCA